MNLDSFASDTKKSLILILGISIFVKLVLFAMSEIINPDAVRYINAAHELLQGNFGQAFRHEKMLGFALFLGLANLIVSDWFLAGKLLSALPLILATVPLYLIARDLFGPRAALATGLMFSVIPYINGMVTEIIKDPLFLLCVTTSLWLVLRGLRSGAWCDLLGSGLFALVATLFRVEGIIYLAIVMAMLSLFACVGSDHRGQRLQALLAFSALPAAAILLGLTVILSGMISPEILTSLQVKFGYYFSLNLLENYQAIYQQLKSVEAKFPGGHVSNDFFEIARHQLPLIYLLGLLQVFAKAIFPTSLLLLGNGLALKGRWKRPLLLLLAIILGFLLMDYLLLVKNNFISSRYMMIPVVFSLVLAGYGLVRLLDSLSSSSYAKFASVMVLFLCIIVPAAESFSVLADQKTVLKTAGEWLEKHRDLERSQIITNDERIAYYAGLMRSSYRVFLFTETAGYEETALRADCELVVLELSEKKSGELPDFRQFKLLEEFSGRRNKVLVYERLK